MLLLLIQALLSSAFQGNQISTKQNILDLIIPQRESKSGYFLLEDKYKYKALLQVCIQFYFSCTLRHARNHALSFENFVSNPVIKKNLKSYHCHRKSHPTRPT